jgi:hypothetical protein
MPDVKVASASSDGTRFVVDVVAAKNADRQISASVVVAEIFPMEQFQPRIKEGEDADALLTSIQYYTLLRLHEVVPAQSPKPLCLSIVADIGDKVLSKEFTERTRRTRRLRVRSRPMPQHTGVQGILIDRSQLVFEDRIQMLQNGRIGRLQEATP